MTSRKGADYSLCHRHSQRLDFGDTCRERGR